MALGAVLAVAALFRFVGLPARGMWDADQGHDMLVLLDWVRSGVVPLVGPPTSIGDLHHGAAYYWLLAPAAFLSGADPLWVVATIALGGVAAVAVLWWFARSVAGPVAGLVASVLVAVSAAAVEASTFIWNPNLIGLSSAVALGAAWQAWSSGRRGWWVVAAAAQAVSMQLHVLGATLIVPLVGLFVADARRPGAGRRGELGRAAAAALAVMALAYAPLLIHELREGFPETRAIVEVLAGRSASEAGPNPLVAMVVIAIRVLSWPLAGLLTDAPVLAIAAAGGIVAILVWRARAGDERERAAARWFGATLAWSVVVLALVAPGLATVTPGLPNDHYHAFLDPLVYVTAGMGAAAAWRQAPAWRPVAAVVVAAAVGWNVAIGPPLTADDGGYPAAELAAERVRSVAGGDRVAILTVPAFKDPALLGFPLRRIGVEVGDRPEDFADEHIVVVCDRLFRDTIGVECGREAEDAAVETTGAAAPADLVERFDLSPRTVISVYR